jgi:DNA-binding PadR family transcriptional regulator
MHQHHAVQRRVSQADLVILACLIDEPQAVTTCYEAVMQATGQLIEPGAFSRMLSSLEWRGWIEASRREHPLRRYQVTEEGALALERGETHQPKEKLQEGKYPDWQRGRKIIMQLVLWVLRLYPPGWRERYEAEMVALLEQHQITLWTVLDLLLGALDARLDPHYRRARQLLPLRRFQTSWKLVVGAMVAFWIALLPWLWMSVLGIGSDTRCSDWQNNSALCMLRVTVGVHTSSHAQALVGTLLGALPILLMAFLTTLVLARERSARTHLLLVLPVTIAMLVLCFACASWLALLWPLLPQISQFYPPATSGLMIGLIGMGLATLLALGSLTQAAFALRTLSAASPRQEPHPFSLDQQAGEAAQDADISHLEHPTVSAAKSNASRVPKRWSVALVLLLLLFAFPLPLLIPFDAGGFLFWLIIWCPAGIVALITALLVKSPGKKQAGGAPQKPRRAPSPLVWAAILPMAFLLLKGWSAPFVLALPVPLWVNMLVYFCFAAFVSGATALLVTIRHTSPRFERPLRYAGIGTAAVLAILVLLGAGRLLPWAGLVGWLLVSCLSIIPALFVRVPGGRRQGEPASGSHSVDAAPKLWGLFLFILLLVSTGRRITAFLPGLPFMRFIFVLSSLSSVLFVLMAIAILPALIVKVRNSNHQAEHTVKPQRNNLSHSVWIVITPVLFLVFCLVFNTIGITDYPDFGDTVLAWSQTSLAALIILVALKLGSSASMVLPSPELLQRTYEQTE